MQVLLVEADWEPQADAGLSEEEHRDRWALDATKAWRHPRWSLAERPRPRAGAGDEVVVRSRAVGICGSDLHMYEADAEGYVLMPYRIKIPLIPGHEVAGEVVEAGPAVRAVKPGDLVAVEALQYCGQCPACRRGLFSHCSNALDSGFGVDGGMAEYLLTRERNARPLDPLRKLFDDQEACEIGALCEPAAVAYLAIFLRGGGVMPGSSAAVFGCGPIGLAAIALLRCSGAARIFAFDPLPRRRELALEMGADVAFEPGHAAETLLEQTGGLGTDVAIEAVGAADVLAQIEASLAVGGKVILLGSSSAPVPSHPVAYMVRGASVHGSIGHVGGFDPVIALQAAGRIDLRPILSVRYELSEGLEAMARAARREDAKVMIVSNDK